MNKLALAIVFLFLPTLAYGYDASMCASANSKVSSASSALSSARTEYDYCNRWGDTWGTGYGDSDCNAAYYSKQDAQARYDRAVSDQWYYCY
jgi:hypothetical protein